MPFDYRLEIDAVDPPFDDATKNTMVAWLEDEDSRKTGDFARSGEAPLTDDERRIGTSLCVEFCLAFALQYGVFRMAAQGIRAEGGDWLRVRILDRRRNRIEREGVFVSTNELREFVKKRVVDRGLDLQKRFNGFLRPRIIWDPSDVLRVIRGVVEKWAERIELPGESIGTAATKSDADESVVYDPASEAISTSGKTKQLDEAALRRRKLIFESLANFWFNLGVSELGMLEGAVSADFADLITEPFFVRLLMKRSGAAGEEMQDFIRDRSLLKIVERAADYRHREYLDEQRSRLVTERNRLERRLTDLNRSLDAGRNGPVAALPGRSETDRVAGRIEEINEELEPWATLGGEVAAVRGIIGRNFAADRTARITQERNLLRRRVLRVPDALPLELAGLAEEVRDHADEHLVVKDPRGRRKKEAADAPSAAEGFVVAATLPSTITLAEWQRTAERWSPILDETDRRPADGPPDADIRRWLFDVRSYVVCAVEGKGVISFLGSPWCDESTLEQLLNGP